MMPEPNEDEQLRSVGLQNAKSILQARQRLEQQVRDQLAAARFLAAIVESSSDAILSKSLDGTIQSWNTGAQHLFGYTAEEAIGQHISFIIPADRADEETYIVERLRAGGQIAHYETVRLRKDGLHVDVSLTVSPIRDETGKVIGASKIARDITDRKQSETALRESEQALTDFFDNATVGLHWMGPDGIILRVNQMELDLLGYDRDEYLGQHIAKFHADAENINDILVRLTSGESISGRDARLLCKDRSIKHVLISSNGLFRDGTFIHSRCFTRDVTAHKQAEAALLYSEQLHRIAFDLAPTGIAYLGLDERFIKVNDAMCDITGYSAEELLQMTAADLTHPDDLSHDTNLLDAFLCGGLQQYANEKRWICKNGGIRWVSVVGRMVTDEPGQPLRSICVIRDVTERRASEEALRTSEARFRTAVGAVSSLIWTNSPEGLMSGEQPGWANFTGQTYDEYQGYGWSQAVHPDDAQETIVAWKHAVAKKTSFVFQHRVRRRDGPWRLCSIKAVPVLNDKGEIQEWVGVHTDITTQREYENALRDSDQRMRLATEATAIGIWEWNLVTDEIKWDSSMFRIYGVPPTADGLVPYKTWTELVLPEDLPEQEAILQETVRERGRSSREFRIRRQDDRECRQITAVETVRLNDLGNAEWVVGTNLDVTERKELEEKLRQHAADLVESDRNKNEFLATLAHELRNPLAPIGNGLKLMRLVGGGGEAVEEVRLMMERQLTQMVRLVDDLMDVSRISTGKIELHKQSIDLSEVMNSAIESTRSLIESMGQKLVVTLPDPPLSLDADPTRLTQVFLNLLNNAAKYSEPGGCIEFIALRQEHEVAVTVTDTGIGIAADQLPRVFELFSQVDRSLEKSQGGLGIGLSLVQRLVELHGGTVEARSDGAGLGSEFCVRLPIKVKLPALQGNSQGRPAAASKTSLRILVVDDNRDSATTLSMLLRIVGNETRTAHDGEEAVAQALEYRPDVILLDLGLPKMNGYEACRLIRKQFNGKKTVIIAQTGWGQEEDRQRTQNAGFNYHMVKPLDTTALIELLTEVKLSRTGAAP